MGIALLWQAVVKQADSDTLAAREQADVDIAQADQDRDDAQAKVATLESELAVLREVVAERDRLLGEVRELRAETLPLREQIARLTVTSEHLSSQLKETKTELKDVREETLTLQAELLTLARGDGKMKRMRESGDAKELAVIAATRSLPLTLPANSVRPHHQAPKSQHAGRASCAHPVLWMPQGGMEAPTDVE
ncbi:hypothetical protein PHA77_19025 (plasmid) [Edwardsiella tarda]|uniref:hypothetical protein n=1 Tax=Edwardsiella tarda TaxID=636 RepID=UPI0024437F6E|nr:hypothetical protein [Edwardsiella tarda]WGE31138.1 hypothetical protein PHA77_19025 [Edwardsiella tarda]